MTKKIYADTNLVSRLSDAFYGNDPQISDDVAAALLKICNCDVEIVTSKEMLDEVLKTVNLKQRALLVLLATLAAKVPFSRVSFLTPTPWGGAAWGSVPWAGITEKTDPRLVQLCGIFDPADARHIFQASTNQCDYFLTFDRKTILSRASKHSEVMEDLCPDMKFVSPEELSAILD